MAKKKAKIQKEAPTINIKYLNDREVSSFNSWCQERRNAIGEDILGYLLPDEIEQVEAVIFNGLVDAYMLSKKRGLKIVRYLRKKRACQKKMKGR